MEVSIYNIIGQRVRTLASNFQEEGHYRVTWDGTDYTGKNSIKGLYLVNLSGVSGKLVSKVFKN
jgi:flagellar hook assembly protein FlgD